MGGPFTNEARQVLQSWIAELASPSLSVIPSAITGGPETSSNASIENEVPGGSEIEEGFLRIEGVNDPPLALAFEKLLCLSTHQKIVRLELLFRLPKSLQPMPERLRVTVQDPRGPWQLQFAQDGRLFDLPLRQAVRIASSKLFSVLAMVWGEDQWIQALNQQIAMINDGEAKSILMERLTPTNVMEVKREHPSTLCTTLKGCFAYVKDVPKVAGHVSPNKGKELEGTEGDVDPSQIPYVRVDAASLWLESQARRRFMGIFYQPFPPEGQPARSSLLASSLYYNLFRGWPIDPERCSNPAPLVLQHLREVLCSGEQDSYEFLLRYLAHLVQKPEEKTEVVLVLRSKQGTGKSIFANLLMKLLGRHAIQVTQEKHILGSFNAHLRYRNLIVLNEAFWAGNKAGEGLLKSAITDSQAIWESKGVDAEEGFNFWNVIILSNNEWCVPATADNRRFYMLPVSEHRIGDTAYFSALVNAIERGGEDRQFFAYLLDYQLPSDWRASQHVASNRALVHQILQSHDQADLRWILDGLSSENWRGAYQPRPFESAEVTIARPGENSFVHKETFLKIYQHDQSRDPILMRHGKLTSITACTQALKKWFSLPELFIEDHRPQRNDTRVYRFGPIEELRRHIAEHVLRCSNYFESF